MNKEDLNIISIIPARGGSKGIPQKNLFNFAGKPLLEWTLAQSRMSNYVSKTYVSSEDKEILEFAQFSGAFTIKRPDEIAGDSASSESSLLHALTEIKKKPDFVVFLQATSPLRKPDDIDNAVKQILHDEADSLLSLVESKEFLWQKSKKLYDSLTFDYKDRPIRQRMDSVFFENGSIYVFKPEIIEQYKNRLGGKVSAYLMEPWQTVDIDDYDDLDWGGWLFKKHLAKFYENGNVASSLGYGK